MKQDEAIALTQRADETEQRPDYRGPAFFSYGFRPFFFGAALLAGVAVPAWIVLVIQAGDSALFHTGRQWHVHEMVFGFLPAVITGFLFTAIPNWIDRPPIRDRELMWVFALWLAGRLVIAIPWPSAVLSAVVDGAFLIAVTWLVWREIAAARSWGHAPMGVLICLYAAANLVFHVLALSGAETEPAQRMALALVMMLLASIGGRVTPNFTREYLGRANGETAGALFPIRCDLNCCRRDRRGGMDCRPGNRRHRVDLARGRARESRTTLALVRVDDLAGTVGADAACRLWMAGGLIFGTGSGKSR